MLEAQTDRHQRSRQNPSREGCGQTTSIGDDDFRGLGERRLVPVADLTPKVGFELLGNRVRQLLHRYILLTLGP